MRILISYWLQDPYYKNNITNFLLLMLYLVFHLMFRHLLYKRQGKTYVCLLWKQEYLLIHYFQLFFLSSHIIKPTMLNQQSKKKKKSYAYRKLLEFLEFFYVYHSLWSWWVSCRIIPTLSTWICSQIYTEIWLNVNINCSHYFSWYIFFSTQKTLNKFLCISSHKFIYIISGPFSNMYVWISLFFDTLFTLYWTVEHLFSPSHFKV